MNIFTEEKWFFFCTLFILFFLLNIFFNLKIFNIYIFSLEWILKILNYFFQKWEWKLPSTTHHHHQSNGLWIISQAWKSICVCVVCFNFFFCCFGWLTFGSDFLSLCVNVLAGNFPRKLFSSKREEKKTSFWFQFPFIFKEKIIRHSSGNWCALIHHSQESFFLFGYIKSNEKKKIRKNIFMKVMKRKVSRK